MKKIKKTKDKFDLDRSYFYDKICFFYWSLNNLQKKTTSDLYFDTYFFWVFFSFSFMIANLFWISKKLEMFKNIFE